MSEDDYIKYLADILSGKPERVRRANEQLYKNVVVVEEGEYESPVLALAKAELQLVSSG